MSTNVLMKVNQEHFERGGRMMLILSTHKVKTKLRRNPGTEAEPQQIVAQRLISCVQYHVPFKCKILVVTKSIWGWLKSHRTLSPKTLL